MNLFFVEIFNLDYLYKYEEMTLEGFLGMCALIVVLLIINRLLGIRPIKDDLFKAQDLSNYILDFETNDDNFTLNVSEKKVSFITKLVIIFIVIVLVIVPISEFILTIESGYFWTY